MENDFGNYIDRGFTYDKERILGAPPKEKTLVVDGCSMAGSNNSDGDYCDIGLNLAKKWNFNCLSLNMSSKSNCSIFRDTTNFLLFNHKKIDISLEKIFLIIEWSGLARYSYFNREKMRWDIYHLWKFDDKKDSHKLHPGKNMDYHSIIEEYMNRFLYQISVANLCENLGVNYIMYNGCDDIKSYQTLDSPYPLTQKIKNYFKYKTPDKNFVDSSVGHYYDTTIYDDFDNLYEVLLTKNFLDIPCTGYFGYETGRYKMDKDRLKKYTYDGLHMNKLGHKEWEKVLEDFIIEKGMGDFIK
jgi:hypothetical protein